MFNNEHALVDLVDSSNCLLNREVKSWEFRNAIRGDGNAQ